MTLNPNDVIIQTYRAAGSGGFGCTPEVAVRITHIPTGLYAESSEDRSVHKNKVAAMEKLEELVANAPVRDDIRIAVASAVAAEREACAKLVESVPIQTYCVESFHRQVRVARETIAEVIRERK